MIEVRLMSVLIISLLQFVTGSGKSGLKSPMIKQQKLAEISGGKFSIFVFWHISLNKMLYYTENVFFYNNISPVSQEI